MVRQLLGSDEHNALEGRDGWTPLHCAATGDDDNHVQKVSALVNDKTNVNVGDGQRAGTPLHIAAVRGNLNIVTLLLDRYSANVEAKMQPGDLTPLHQAARRGHKDVILRLLEAGARTDARSSFGLTPHQYACLNNHEDAASLLASRCPDSSPPSADMRRLWDATLSADLETLNSLGYEERDIVDRPLWFVKPDERVRKGGPSDGLKTRSNIEDDVFSPYYRAVLRPH
jgi:ankyrin repeat protein